MRALLILAISFFSLIGRAELEQVVAVGEVVRFSLGSRLVQFKDAVFEIETQDENYNNYRTVVPAAVELNERDLTFLLNNPSMKVMIVHRVNGFREMTSCLHPELAQQKNVRNSDGTISTKDICYVINPSFVVFEP